MDKEKRILIYFISFLLGLLTTMLIGITDVFAEEISPTTGYRTQLGSFNQYSGEVIWQTSNIGQYNTPLYFTEGQEYYNFFIPGYIRLAVITDVNTSYSYKISYNMTIYDLKTSNWDISKINTNYDLRVNDDSSIVKDYKCSVVSSNFIEGTNGNTIENTISCVFNVNYNVDDAWLNTGYICKDCTLSGVESFGTVTSDAYMYVTNPKLERFEDNSGIIIDQNQTIIDQNNKTNEELGNIKESINESTEDMIQSQVACSFIDKTNIKTDNYYLNGRGVEISGNIFGITDYINVLGGKLKLLQVDEYNAYACFYNVNKELISCTATNSLALGEMTIPNNANYVRFTINKSTNKPTFELCRNGNQAIVDSQNQMNDKLDNLQDSITDSSSPDIDGLADSAGWLPPGPLDSVLNLPLSLFNSLTTNLNKSCSPISIPLPYVNKNLTIPCINTLYDKIGVSTFITWLGVIVSGLMLYTYLLKLYKWIEDRISLNETHSVDNWGGL